MKLYVGDLVAPNSTGYSLASGCSYYDQAVVVCINPFVLVSEGGDMRWNTLDPENYKAVGYADAETLKRCIDRMNRDLMQDVGDEHNRRLMKQFYADIHDKISRNDLEGFERAVEMLVKSRES